MAGTVVLRITAEERAAHYPSDALVEPPTVDLFRAIDVAASPATLFAWLGQLRFAPYSYDLLDNLGRGSPEELPPDAPPLAEGQQFMLGPIVSFEPSVHITARAGRSKQRIFGAWAFTYRIVPRPDGGCRLIVKGSVHAGGRLSRLRARLIAAGDVVMMRKQMLRLKALAERDERRLRERLGSGEAAAAERG